MHNLNKLHALPPQKITTYESDTTEHAFDTPDTALEGICWDIHSPS